MNTEELEKLVSKYEGYLLSLGELGVEAVELLSVRDKIEEYLIEGYDIIPIHILAEIMRLDLTFKEEFEIFRKEFSRKEVAHFQKSVREPATHWWWHLVMIPCTEHPHIDRKPGVCGGKPKIIGTRLPVWVLAGYHKMGLLDDEILRMYSHITAAQFYDALSYYYDHKDEIDELLAKNTEEYWMKKTEGKLWRR